MITREQVAEKVRAYLVHQLSPSDLVEWAEDAMQEEEFESEYFEEIRDVVSRIGVMDVRAFGLTWEECEAMLGRLGYQASIEIIDPELRTIFGPRVNTGNLVYGLKR